MYPACMCGTRLVLLTASAILLQLGCGKSTPSPELAPVAATPGDAVIQKATPAPTANPTTVPPPDAAPSTVDSAPTAGPPDDPVTAADAGAPEIAVEARETAIALLVPKDGRFAALACWIIPARDASPRQEEAPRWAQGDACLPFVQVGATTHGRLGAGTITAIEGAEVSAAPDDFLVVAPTGDRRLATILPTRPGLLESLGAPADAPPSAGATATPGGPVDATPASGDAALAAPSDAAAIADADPVAPPVDPDAGKPRRAKPTDEQREAVRRAIERLNGSDYRGADITVGDVIWADVNGDDKLDAILLGSSFDLGGEGHSAGGGTFFADGRNPARLHAMAVEGQMTDVDVLALSDLDGDGRREVLLKMECPTGTGYYLAQWSALFTDGPEHLGAVELDDGVLCAGFGDARPPALPGRTFTHPALVAQGLGAFAAPFGIPLGSPTEAVAARLGMTHDEGTMSFEIAGGDLSLFVEAGVVRALSTGLDGARFAAERLGDSIGLDRLLDYHPKELAAALRPHVGRQRLMNTVSVAFDGPVPGGRSIFLAFDCSEDLGCYHARVALYEPRKALGVRTSFLGLTSQSRPDDVAKVFGPPEATTSAAPGPLRYAAGKVEATFDKGALKTFTIDREALAAAKKPGVLAALGEPLAKLATRFGAPDDTETRDGMETAYWYLPTPEVWETTVKATCAPGGTCDRMTISFY